MFKHILVPTDGSDLSQETCRAAARFAKELGARITAFHARPELSPTTFSAAIFCGEGADPATREQFEKAAEAGARKSLDFAMDVCREFGVPCSSMTTPTDAPSEGIVAAAGQCGADLIFMASRGRRGLKAQLIGSETQRVLTHSPIPVLVYHWGVPQSP